MLASKTKIGNRIHNDVGMTRRNLLTLAAPLAIAPEALRGERTPLSPGAFKARLRSPILSFPTVYDARFAIDFDGVRAILKKGLGGGAGVVALTKGNNQYDTLTQDEVRQLTRMVVEA